MNFAKRELAPIASEAWTQLDEEARRVLVLNLSARKFVDFRGPLGLDTGAVNTGRVTTIESPFSGVQAKLRNVLPLIELRVTFELSREELDDASRGARDLDLDPLIEAAERIARAEDHAVYHGYPAAKVSGIAETSKHRPVMFREPRALPFAVAEAKEVLRRGGVDGPYALLLGPTLYDETSASAEDGYPIRRRIDALVDLVVWAPALDHGVLVSMRGGDFELICGQDLMLGYESHDDRTVRLYLYESFTSRVLETSAAVVLRKD